MAMKDLLLGTPQGPDEDEDEEDLKVTEKYSSFAEMMDDVGFGTLSSEDYGQTLRVPADDTPANIWPMVGGPIAAAAQPDNLLRIVKALGDMIGIGEVEKEEYDIRGGGIPLDVTERGTQLGDDTDKTLDDLGRILGKDSAAIKRLQYWNRLMGNIGTDTMVSPIIDTLQGEQASWTRSGEYKTGKLAIPTNLEDKLADHLVAPLLGGLFPGIGAYMAVKVPAKAFLTGAAGLRAMGRVSQTFGAAQNVTKLGTAPVAAARTAELFADMASGFGLAGFYGAREGLEREGKINLGETALYGAMGAGIGAVISGPFQYFGIRRSIRNLDDALEAGVIQKSSHVKYIQDHLPADTQIGDRVWDGNTWRWAEGAETVIGLKRKKGSYAPAPWKAEIQDKGALAELLTKAQLNAVQKAFKDHRITNKPLNELWRSTGGFNKALNDLDLKIKATGGNGIADVLAQAAGFASQSRKAQVTVPHQIARIAGQDPSAAWSAQSHASAYVESATTRYHTDTFENYVEAINTLDAIANDPSRPMAQQLAATAEASAMKHAAFVEGGLGPKELQAAGVSLPIESVNVADGATVNMAATLSKAPTEMMLERDGFDGVPGLSHFRGELYDNNLPNSRRLKAQMVLDLVEQMRKTNVDLQLDKASEQVKREMLRRSASQSRGLSAGMDVLTKNEAGEWVGGIVVEGTRHGNVRVQVGGKTKTIKAVDLIIQPEDGDWARVRMPDGSYAPAKIKGIARGNQGNSALAVIAKADGSVVELDISPADIETVGRYGGKSEVAANKAVADDIRHQFERNIGDALPEGLQFINNFEDTPYLVEWRGHQWKVTRATGEPKHYELYSDEYNATIIVSHRKFMEHYTRGSLKKPQHVAKVDGSGRVKQNPGSVVNKDDLPRVVKVDKTTNAQSEVIPSSGPDAGEVPWEQAELSLEQTPAPDWPDSPVTGELEHAALTRRTVHSGGAAGADTAFEEEGLAAGLAVKAHTFEGGHLKNANRVEHTAKELAQADVHLKKANQTLGRRFPAASPKVNNLLRRNYFQVKDSESVVAVGWIKNGQVEGGTAWATQMGVDMDKRVFVFDQHTNQWFRWEDAADAYVKTVPPAMKDMGDFAGIGSRNLRDSGRKAIRDFFNPVSGATPTPKTRPYGKFGKGQLPASPNNHISFISVPHAAAKKVMTAWQEVIDSGGSRQAFWDALVQADPRKAAGGTTGVHGQIYATQVKEGMVTLALEMGPGAAKTRIRHAGFGPTINFIQGKKATLKDLLTAKATYKKGNIDDVVGIYHVEDDLLLGDLAVPSIKDILARGDPAEIDALRATFKRQLNASNNLPPGFREASQRVTANVTQEAKNRKLASATVTATKDKTSEVRNNLELLLGIGDRPITTPDALDRDALAAARGVIDMLATWRNWPVLSRIPGARRFGKDHPFVQATSEMMKIQKGIDDQIPRPKEADFRNPTTGEFNQFEFNSASAEWERNIKRAYRDAGAHNPVLQALNEAGVSDIGEDAVTIKVPHRTIPGEFLEIQVTYPDMKNPARVASVRAMSRIERGRTPRVEIPDIDKTLSTIPESQKLGDFEKGGYSVALLGGAADDFAGVSEEELKNVIWKAIKVSGLKVGNIRTRAIDGKRLKGGVDAIAYNMTDDVPGATKTTHNLLPKRRIFSNTPEAATADPATVIPSGESKGSLDNIIKPAGRGAIVDGTKQATVRTEKMKIFKGDGWYEIDGKPIYVRYLGEKGHTPDLQQAAFGGETPRFGAQKDWAEGNRDLHVYSFSQEGPEVQQQATQRYFDVVRSRAQDGDDQALFELARMVKTGKSKNLKEVRQAAETIEFLEQRGLSLDAEGQPVYGTTYEGFVRPEFHETNPLKKPSTGIAEGELPSQGIFGEEVTAARVAETGEPFPTGTVDKQISGYDPVKMEATVNDLQAAVFKIRTNKKNILKAAEKSPIPDEFDFASKGGAIFRKQLQRNRESRVPEKPGILLDAAAGDRGQNEFADRLTMAGMDAINAADAVIYVAKSNPKDNAWGLARATRLAEQQGKPVTVVYRTGNGTEAHPYQWKVHKSKQGPQEDIPRYLEGRSFPIEGGTEQSPIRMSHPSSLVGDMPLELPRDRSTLFSRRPQIEVKMSGISDGVNLGAQRRIPVVALQKIVTKSQWARMERETARALDEGVIPPIWAYYREWLAGINNEAYDINKVITRESHPWHYHKDKKTGELREIRYQTSYNTKKKLVKGEALKDLERQSRAAPQDRDIVGDQYSNLDALGDTDRILDNQAMTDLLMESELIDDLARGLSKDEGISFRDARADVVKAEIKRLQGLWDDSNNLKRAGKTGPDPFQERLNRLDRVPSSRSEYVLPEPPPSLDNQALELAAILHNFDLSKGNRLGVGEFIHKDNASVFGWLQRMRDKNPYWVSLRHDALPGHRSQQIDQIHKFATRDEAVKFLEDTGFERNQNNMLFSNDEMLGDLPDPFNLQDPADIIEMNAKLGQAIATARTKHGFVPAALIDYANDFADRGWGRFFDVDHPALLWDDANLKAIGRSRREGGAGQLGASALRSKSRTIGLQDGKITQLIPESEIGKLENPAMGSYRELANYSPVERQREWERLGMDQYDQQQFLAYAYTDMNSPVGTGDPSFQQDWALNWVAYPQVLYEEGGRIKAGLLHKANSGPGRETVQIKYFDTALDEKGQPSGWKTKTLEKGESYMSVRPGDPWDPRKIAAGSDYNQGMRMHRADVMGSGSFDQDWGLSGITDQTEYKSGMFDALKSILGVGDSQASPFIVKKGDDLMFSMAGAKPEEIDQFVDWFIRFAETQGRQFEGNDLQNVLSSIKKEMGITGNIHRQSDILEVLQARGLDRARAMVGDPDEPVVDLLAKARLAMLPKKLAAAFREAAGTDPKKGKFGLKNVDDMSDLDVAEYVISRMDRNLAAEIPLVQRTLVLDHLAGLTRNQKGFTLGLHEYREAGGKVLELVTKHAGRVGRITQDAWFGMNNRIGMFPRTVGERSPTFNFYYNKVSQIDIVEQKVARDLRDTINKHWGIYDPKGEALSDARSIIDAGYRDWDDFVLNGDPADVARLKDMIITAPGEWDGKEVPSISFKRFFGKIHKNFEAGRYDLIETQFTAGDAPVIKVTESNFTSEEVKRALGEYERLGGIASDVGHIVMDEGKTFHLTMPRDNATFRSEAEVDFFMNTMIRGLEETKLLPATINDQLNTRGWGYMIDEWEYYRGWGADMNWPAVNTGRFRLTVKMPNEKEAHFGMVSSLKDGRKLLRRLRREGDPILKAIDDAVKAGEDAYVQIEPPDWTNVDSEHYSIMSPDVYRGFMNALEKEGVSKAELASELQQVGIKGQVARHTGFERPNGVKLQQKKGWTDNPYDELQIYFNKIMKAKYVNQKYRAAETAKMLDPQLSKAYGLKPIFSEEIAAIAGGTRPGVFPEGAKKLARKNPYYRYMEDHLRAITGERTDIEKGIDKQLQLWNWLEEKAHVIPEALDDLIKKSPDGDPLVDLDKIYRISMSKDGRRGPYNSVYHRKFGSKNLSQGIMHGQAVMRLGFSPASAMVNGMQWLVNTMPILGVDNTKAGLKDAVYFFRSADAGIAKKEIERLSLAHGADWKGMVKAGKVEHKIPKNWLDIHDTLEQSGVELVTGRAQAEELLGVTLGENPKNSPLWHPGNKGKELWESYEYYSLMMFNGAERLNRATTAIAAGRAAANEGLTGPAKISFIRKAIEQTQFTYSEIGLPPMMRSSHMRALTQFKPFMFNQLKFEADLVKRAVVGSTMHNDWSGWGPLAKHYAVLGTLGGVAGLAYSPLIYGLGAAAGMLMGTEEMEGTGGRPFDAGKGDYITNLLFRLPIVGDAIKEQGKDTEWGRLDNPWFQAKNVVSYGLFGAFDADVSRRLSVTGPELLVSRLGDLQSMLLGPHFSMYADMVQAMRADKTVEHIGGNTSWLALAASAAALPYLKGWGGLVAGVGTAQVASALTSAGPDRALISPSILSHEAKKLIGPFIGGYTEDTRDPRPGALFASQEGQRFVRNMTPTMLRNQLMTAEIMSYGEVHDLGGNLDRIGPAGWTKSGPRNSEVLRESILRWLGLSSTRSGKNRIYTQVARNEQEAFESEREMFTQMIADAVISGDSDFASLMYEARKRGIYIDNTMLTSKILRATTPAIQYRLENRPPDLR